MRRRAGQTVLQPQTAGRRQPTSRASAVSRAAARPCTAGKGRVHDGTPCTRMVHASSSGLATGCGVRALASKGRCGRFRRFPCRHCRVSHSQVSPGTNWHHVEKACQLQALGGVAVPVKRGCGCEASRARRARACFVRPTPSPGRWLFRPSSSRHALHTACGVGVMCVPWCAVRWPAHPGTTGCGSSMQAVGASNPSLQPRQRNEKAHARRAEPPPPSLPIAKERRHALALT